MKGRFSGSCHCGAVRFDVELDADYLMECNCSICRRAGWLLASVPERAVSFTSGEDVLQDYQFGRKQIHHAFCPRCGVRAIGWGTGEDGAKHYAVNARCLAGFDPQGVEVRQFDGANL